ncbi:hypothetical protein GFS60_04214 [Rhodococcus sp. WAY2]|nr:hypothetical protein GFS60_04214 [Rhodococcus sp. WAY2]
MTLGESLRRAPSKEYLEHFGMTARRFTERLCQLTPASHCALYALAS